MVKFELIDEDELCFVIDLGDREFGLVFPEQDPEKVEIWFDHQYDGSGCNNYRIAAHGQDLDLEFCRSRQIRNDEREAMAAELNWHLA